MFYNLPEIKSGASIDWLTVTSKTDRDGEKGRAMIESLWHCNTQKIEYRKDRCYRNVLQYSEGISLRLDAMTEETGTSILITGSGMRYLRDRLRYADIEIVKTLEKHGYNLCSRIDTAMDDVGCEYLTMTDVKQMHPPVDDKGQSVLVTKIRKVDWFTGTSGDTLYFGFKTQSDFKARIYDKRAEQMAKNPAVVDLPEWLRLEAEIHGDLARHVFRQIADGASVADCWLTHFAGRIRFDDYRWERFLNAVQGNQLRLSAETMEYTDPQKVINNVDRMRKVLGEFVYLFGEDALLQIARQGIADIQNDETAKGQRRWEKLLEMKQECDRIQEWDSVYVANGFERVGDGEQW